MKKLVGKVSVEEMDEIKSLYERKNGLIEIIKAIPDINGNDSSALYEKIVQDMATTNAKYSKWFEEKSKKYNWENIENHNWEVNFASCEVFITNK